MTILYIFLVAYFVLMIGIGIYGRRYAHDYQDSINMGKKGGAIIIAGASLGSSIGNGFVVGGAGAGSISGLAGAAYGFACAFAILAIALILTGYIYKNKYTSLADFTKKRYNSDLPGNIYLICNALLYLGVFAAQLIAGRLLFELLGMDGRLWTIIIAIVIFLYSEMAGVWGAYATSVIQTVIIVSGLILTTSIIILNGGVAVIKEGIAVGTAPRGALDFSGLGIMGFMALGVPAFLSVFTDHGVYVGVNCAESAKKAKTGYIIAFALMIPLAILPAFIGAYGATKYGITGDQVFFSVILNELSPVVSAIIVVAVLAAVMSTIDVAYASVDTIVISELLCKLLKKEYSNRQLITLKLIINVTLTILAVLISLNAGLILDVLYSFYTLLNAACLVPFVGGILFKKAPTIAATSSSIAGIACVVLGWCGINLPSLGGFFPCVVGAVVFLIITLISRLEL